MQSFHRFNAAFSRLAKALGFLLLANPRLLAAASPELTNIPPSQAFTFVVLGDNRGDDSGDQPPAFSEVLQEVERVGPAFVLDSGDMIYGHTSEETRVRDQWRRYREAIQRFRPPIFHVPGNHDLWDEPSARIYRELWGNPYFSFDYGNSRFIGLDTETANGHLGEEQLHWLETQFRGLTQTNVFVFLHRPLFPVDGGIGSSLDKFESERDQIHQLFVRNRKFVRGVFAGHEHLYSFQPRDGVPYYISGGAGAPLYIAPELGGFHHFLRVQVRGDQVEVELNKGCAPVRPLEHPKTIRPGEVLESWTRGLFWYAWDQTASVELTPEHASEGSRALRLNFDLAQYAWPVLALSLSSPLDLSTSSALSLDVFVPSSLEGSFSLTPAVQGITKHEGPPVHLKPGWNAVKTDLNGDWLPRAERASVAGLEWSLSSEAHPSRGPSRGYVVFDNLHLLHSGTNSSARELLESWERPLLWRVFDETVHAEIVQGNKPAEPRGLLMRLDFGQCNRPVLFARLNPPWDLTQIKALRLQVTVPNSFSNDLALTLLLRAKDQDFASPALPLRAGTRRLSVDLEDGGLPTNARAALEQVGFRLRSTYTNGPVQVTFENLTAADGLSR